jgi:RNA polymerase sigma-70 factor (ECF subfamily)
MERTTPPPTDPVEVELLGRAQGGDLLAFEEIVRRHQRRVYGTALRIVRRHDVADDVVQDTFLRAYQALKTFDLARPFGPWIARIAANLSINYIRSPRFREEPLPEAHGETPSSSPSPLGGVLESESGSMLEAALFRLPAEQRAVFVLRALEDLSYKEISESLGISMGTVMSRLSRAREKLREALLPYLETSKVARSRP